MGVTLYGYTYHSTTTRRCIRRISGRADTCHSQSMCRRFGRRTFHPEDNDTETMYFVVVSVWCDLKLFQRGQGNKWRL